ncbi:putative betaine-aldehyde dehydrogenase [Helianthus debilis subsp. tardiflorus]
MLRYPLHIRIHILINNKKTMMELEFEANYELNSFNHSCAMFVWHSVTLELGGKSPIVVFDDVGIDKGLFNCFVHHKF